MEQRRKRPWPRPRRLDISMRQAIKHDIVAFVVAYAVSWVIGRLLAQFDSPSFHADFMSGATFAWLLCTLEDAFPGTAEVFAHRRLQQWEKSR